MRPYNCQDRPYVLIHLVQSKIYTIWETKMLLCGCFFSFVGIPSACKQVVSVETTRDIEWATYTCTLGFHVFGKYLSSYKLLPFLLLTNTWIANFFSWNMTIQISGKNMELLLCHFYYNLSSYFNPERLWFNILASFKYKY